MTDKVLGTDQTGDGRAEFYQTNVSTATDYYPFGSAMPGRSLNPGDYRFGFNGIEQATEITAGHNTTFYREQDTRIAKWWSLDPKSRKFESPYAMIGNNPIIASDYLGDTLKLNQNDNQARQDIENLAGEYSFALHQEKDIIIFDKTCVEERANEIKAGYKNPKKGQDAYDKYMKKFTENLGAQLLFDLSSCQQTIIYGTIGDLHLCDRRTNDCISPPVIFPTSPPGTVTQQMDFFFNASVTPYTTKNPSLLPQYGAEGQVWIANGDYYEGRYYEETTTNVDGEKIKSKGWRTVQLPRVNLIYHELKENYLRTVMHQDYPTAHGNAVSGAIGTSFEIGGGVPQGSFGINHESGFDHFQYK